MTRSDPPPSSSSTVSPPVSPTSPVSSNLRLSHTLTVPTATIVSTESIEVFEVDDVGEEQAIADPTDNINVSQRQDSNANANDDSEDEVNEVSSTESVPAYYDSSEQLDDENQFGNDRDTTEGGAIQRHRRQNLPTFVVLPAIVTSPGSNNNPNNMTMTPAMLKERRQQQDLRFRLRYGRPLFERQESNTNLSQRFAAEGLSQQGDLNNDVSENDGDIEEANIRNQTSNHGSFGVVGPQENGHDKRKETKVKDNIETSTARCLYRRDQLAKEIEDAAATAGDIKNGGGSNRSFQQVIKTLQQAGVTVYLIDAKVCVTLNDIVDAIQHGVISHILENQTGSMSNLKCCLYRDMDGRLFNLTLVKSYTSAEGTFVDLLQSFSTVQAATLLVVLFRSFSCAEFILPASFVDGEDGEGAEIFDFRPSFLALIVGLVFGEEIGQSWVHVAMLVRGLPSISALTLKEGVLSSDWVRKALVFILAISGYYTGRYQQICTLLGLSLTCWVLLANLGSRSYKHLQWKPIKPFQCCGFWGRSLTPFYAYTVAVLTGLCFPYLGHPQGKTGGTVAVESSLRIAVIVAALFILSDYDEIQEFLVIGSKNCNQDYVNFAVGAWWSLSLICCLSILLWKDHRKKQANPDNLLAENAYCVLPDDDEPLLEEDHASPVGYLVPRLAVFPVDPSRVDKGWGTFCCFGMFLEYALGVAFAVGIGGFICYLGLTDVDNKVLDNAF